MYLEGQYSECRKIKLAFNMHGVSAGKGHLNSILSTYIKGRKRDPIPQSCLLTSTHAPWHTWLPSYHTHMNTNHFWKKNIVSGHCRPWPKCYSYSQSKWLIAAYSQWQGLGSKGPAVLSTRFLK